MLTRISLLGTLLAAFGCASPGPAPAQTPQSVPGAHLEVVNLTGYEWSITLARSPGNEAQTLRVQPQAAVRLDLHGGDYVVDQQIVAAIPNPGLTRRISVRFEPGQTYRWPLMTLLSDPADNPEPDRRP